MKRFRHLRSNQEIRDRSAEVVLSADEFILPLFIVEGTGQLVRELKKRRPICLKEQTGLW